MVRCHARERGEQLTEGGITPMKKIETIFTPDNLQPITSALMRAGLSGLTVTEVVKFFRERKHIEPHEGTEYTSNALREVKIDLILEDKQVEVAVAAIRSAFAAGEGSVFVSPMLDVVRLSTGEHGTTALASRLESFNRR
jgi:nitrogen regulatory protein P-II 1